MYEQQKINDEIVTVKATILRQLSESSHQLHQHLLSELTHTANSEWLDLAAEQLGTEYNPLIERMTKLEAAISQMEIGQYGYCCDCEEEISQQQLTLDPATQRCHKCTK